MAAMRDKGPQPDENVADQVAGSLVYYPKLEQVFAVSGCKTVANRVHLYRYTDEDWFYSDFYCMYDFINSFF